MTAADTSQLRGRQLVLGFPGRADFSSKNFMDLSCNHDALVAVSRFPATDREILVIYGEQATGKTHLLHVWAEQSGDRYVDITTLREVPFNLRKVAVDNLDQATRQQQENLFFLFNFIMSEGGALLIASRTPPAQMDLIPELRSRLLTGQQIEMKAPSADDLERLLVKWAADRQLTLSPEIIRYLLTRCERSAATLQHLVSRLDSLSLEQKRRITIPLVREALERSAQID